MQYGIVSRAQAVGAGLSTKQLRARVVARELDEVFPGVYRLPAFPRSFHQNAMAATLAAGPGAVASLRTAGFLYGFPNIARSCEVTIPAARRALPLPGVQVHRSRLWLPGDATGIQGIPATSAVRTLFDLAGQIQPAALGRMLDYCLVNRLVQREDAVLRLGDLRRRHRACQPIADLLADRPEFVRPPDSTYELDLFGVLDRAGVERPIPQCPVRMPDGSTKYIDFGYPALKIGIDAESYRWHASRSAWERDHARNNELVALGWRVLLITWGMLHDHPDQVVDLIQRARAQQGAA